MDKQMLSGVFASLIATAFICGVLFVGVVIGLVYGIIWLFQHVSIH